VSIEYECVSCSYRFASNEAAYTCPRCATKSTELSALGGSRPTGFRRGNLVVVQAANAKSEIGARADPLAMLPLPITLTASFPVGNTPLIGPERLRSRCGLKNLFFKNDSLNPSGSLKDRASLLVAEQALENRQDTVVLASTGNAGSAMACAGAAAGLRVVLFVPETAPKAKLVQSLLYGACVVPVKGTYDDAFALSIDYTRKFGGINRNTAYNPLTVEGKKTVSVEIYNQLGFRAPDLVYVPAGDGVIFAGVYKGFSDLVTAGYIDRIPSLVLVQAEGSNAIAQSWKEKREIVLGSAVTIADSLAVQSPAAGELALRALAKSSGRAVEVSDDDIGIAQKELADGAGVYVEPSSAAAWAGIRTDLPNIDPAASVVCLLTGTGFKDPEAAEGLVELPPPCAPDLAGVRTLLSEQYGIG
jgi:threonine synthase